MKNKTIIFAVAIVFILSLSSVYAANTNTVQTLGCFEKGTTINLKQTCGNCTYNNITSVELTQKSKTVLSQVAMIKSGTEYLYTLPTSNTSGMGRYIVNGFGNLDGEDTVWAYDFFVTADGRCPVTFPMELILLVISYIILFLTLFLKKGRILQYISSILLIVLGTITLVQGYSYIDYSTLLGLSIGIISIGVGLYYLFENSFSYQRQVKNYDPDDDGRYHDN